MTTLGIIGDIHGQFDVAEARALDACHYDLLLFVGDFAGFRPQEAARMGSIIRRMKTRAIAIPGNHDGIGITQFLAEVSGKKALRSLFSGEDQRSRVRRIETAFGHVPCEGYRLHLLPELGLQVLTARPHSFGGRRLAFARYLEARYGVRSMEESAAKIVAQLDEADRALPLIILAHNGPTGLGERRHSIYGCDFRPEEGDFGDPDLRLAIDEIVAGGWDLRAVIAGHMHHRLKGGGEREWMAHEGAMLHLNAACFPRHREDGNGKKLRPHYRLKLGEGELKPELIELAIE